MSSEIRTERQRLVVEYAQQHPFEQAGDYDKAALALNIPANTIRQYAKQYGLNTKMPGPRKGYSIGKPIVPLAPTTAPSVVTESSDRATRPVMTQSAVRGESNDLAIRVRKHLTGNRSTKDELADLFNVAPRVIQAALETLREEACALDCEDGAYSIPKEIRPIAEPIHETLASLGGRSGTFLLGETADWHVGSKYCREDVITKLYEWYKERGVSKVHLAGNWADGESSLNMFDLAVHGLTPQIHEFIRVCPQIPGITTDVLSGDDHEGWWVQREGINVGQLLGMEAKKAGREDITDIGYMERDIELAPGQILRIIHGGGGSAYATSYAAQKYVECVPMDAQILTPSGWKTRDALHIGDTVLGYDLTTDRCQWTTVSAITDGEAEVVTYRNDNFVVRCTRNHRWAIQWESRGGKNDESVMPVNYVKAHVLMGTIDEARDRSRIIQAALSPGGSGFKVNEHVDWVDREHAVAAVMQMASDQRKAFIYGMMLGEGTIGNKQCIVFSQRPGPVNDAFVLACFLEGIACGTASQTTKKMNGEDKVCNRTTVLRKRMRMVDSLREVSSAVEPVWCPTTGLGTWVMRQGDVITITGNSLQGGEKPRVVVMGHYHKYEFGYPREVYVLQPGCCEDQTPFMRKRKLQAHVGGCIMEVHINDDGILDEVGCTFKSFFDKKFYQYKE